MNRDKRIEAAFDLYLTPGGDVLESAPERAGIARRMATEDIELSPGGMIVMSTDVNATGSGGVAGWAKSFMKTWYNRFMKSRFVDETVKDLLTKRGMDSGWSVGRLFDGRYFSPKTDDTFNEKSFSIDIKGVPFKFVRDAAKALAKKFDQESVLAVDNKTGKTVLVFA